MSKNTETETKNTHWTAFGLMGLGLMAAVGVSLANVSGNGKFDPSGLMQEQMGYSVVLDHYVDKNREISSTPTYQEQLGHQVVLDHFVSTAQAAQQQLHALKQEQMGLRYMLEHKANKRSR